MDIHEFASLELCEDALLSHISGSMNSTLSKGEKVKLALAGGNTPKGLYTKLSNTTLDWEEIAVTLTDERWVDSMDEASNERMLKQTLFQNKAKIGQFLGLKNSKDSPELGQSHTASLLREHFSRLDYVVLGMGDDGHFASIFPYMDNTDALLDLEQTEECLPALPKGQPARMSLTLRYLLTAKHIFLLVTGQDKKEIIQQQSNENASPILPIYRLLHQTHCPVTIYWSEA
ncbi:6-phosphogluconolactonase [Pseudomonas sp. HK3]